VGALHESVALPDEASSLAGLERLPDLGRWRAETARLESELRLKRRSRWPDLDVGVGWRRYEATGEYAFVAGLGLTLPVFDRLAGAVAESSALLDHGRLEQRAEELRLESALRASLEGVATMRAEVRTLKEELLPRARQSYDALNEGYRRGKFSLLDLLEARRGLAAAQLRCVDALVRLNAAKVDLDRLLAGSATTDIGDTP
jgi:cobalt-zinc-cadmium efflux system outer membrane protein